MGVAGACLHDRGRGARAADGALRLPGRGAHRAVAVPGRDGRRRHRRHARAPVAGQGAGAVVRRRAARQHRRLPDLRVRPDGAAVDRRLPARRPVGRHGGGAAAGRLLLPVLPHRRQDRGPLLHGLPELLERGRVLRRRLRPRRGGDDGGAARADRADLRADQVRLPLAHRDALVHQHGAGHGVPRPLRRDHLAAARRTRRADRAVAGLPGLLRRHQPLADAAHRDDAPVAVPDRPLSGGRPTPVGRASRRRFGA